MAQIPLLIVLLLMAIAVPVATTLVQNNADSRNYAQGVEDTGKNIVYTTGKNLDKVIKVVKKDSTKAESSKTTYPNVKPTNYPTNQTVFNSNGAITLDNANNNIPTLKAMVAGTNPAIVPKPSNQPKGPDEICQEKHPGEQCVGVGSEGACSCNNSKGQCRLSNNDLSVSCCYDPNGTAVSCNTIDTSSNVAINGTMGPNGYLNYLDEASAASQCANGYHKKNNVYFCGADGDGDGSGTSSGGSSTTTTPTGTGTGTGTGVGTPSVLNYKIAYNGVNPNSSQCLVDWPLQIIVLGGGESKAYTGVIPTSKATVGNKLVFSGSLTLNGFGQTSNVAVFIKGSKHLQVKYGKDNQTDAYDQAGGVLTLTSNITTSPIHDFSGYPLLPGDVVGISSNVQDGWVNGVDFALVKSKSLVHETVQSGGYLIADLDGNCQVNSNDVNLLKISLQDKQGQLY